jgi:hypothetical protein
MPGQTLFEAVPGPLRDPERRLVAGLDLQPGPGDAEAAVGPQRGARTASRSEYSPRIVISRMRRSTVIDLMQDAFYSRAKADEPRRLRGLSSCRQASRLTLPTGHGEAGKALG